jgi:hypothetical protein
MVNDSSRLGIGDDVYLELPEKTESLMKMKMRDDFEYASCKEIRVYVRPEGESNFFPLDFPGWNRTGELGIPYYKDKESSSDEESVLPSWPARNNWSIPEYYDEYSVYYGKEAFWTEKNKWDVPKYDEGRLYSMYFHNALCNGTRLPSNDAPCTAEIKAEVLCDDKNTTESGKGGRKKVIQQTCYRANLISDGPKRMGKGQRNVFNHWDD